MCPGLGGCPAEQAAGVRDLFSEVRGLGNGLGLIGSVIQDMYCFPCWNTGHVLLL